MACRRPWAFLLPIEGPFDILLSVEDPSVSFRQYMPIETFLSHILPVKYPGIQNNL